VRVSDGLIDVLVVGGGINGVGIAREAAGRGLSVLLVEKDDLAAHTSSASSKLVHGGLRYLDQFDFKLVRESLAERERLLRSAPHIVEPLQFVLPLTEWSPSAWKVRAGLLLYDRLGERRILPPSRPIRLNGPFGNGLQAKLARGFAYWDCRVQDSRLVVLTAMSAVERAAKIMPRTELLEARREDGTWVATYRQQGLRERTIRARALVNAAGPWTGQLSDRLSGTDRPPPMRLVKGSHIVLPRLYDGEHAFILPGPDGRVVFAIPFEGEFTLVGTTDVDCSDPGDAAAISDQEIEYLLAVVGRTFTRAVARADIAWSYTGIRTLADDGTSDPSKISREYQLDLNAMDGAPPLLSVIGGKITTYCRLAEKAVDLLEPFLPEKRRRWDDEPLPGGDIKLLDVNAYLRELTTLRYRELPPELLERLVRTYGTRTGAILKVAKSIEDLGEHFGAGLTEREVDYLIRCEWARIGEDVLWRRTKLGLQLSKAEAARVAEYVEAKALLP
jgi:glycerol-3-phosphate dehydrogenase